ncbi:MAG: helix-turn-helix transcriptional regulator [Acidaminococcaceae bacterium]|nr:helix-turn-helix transcriptional regulator [Acidaminococcaceae bacterium]
MEKIDYKKLGMEIKIRRLRAEVSQSDLARQIGISQSHLCNVENGRLSPSLRLLLSLRKLLGCNIDELLIEASSESQGKQM